jgi:hypothetical protein
MVSLLVLWLTVNLNFNLLHRRNDKLGLALQVGHSNRFLFALQFRQLCLGLG